MQRSHRILFSGLILGSLSCGASKDEGSRSILSGSWGSACLPSAGAQPAIRIQYHFENDHSVLRQQQYFLDSGCQELAGEIAHRGRFALEVRSEVSLFNIDMFFSEVKAKAASAAGVSLWNTLKLCGFEDWTLAAERNVLGNAAEACLSFGVQEIAYRDVVNVLAEQRITFGQSLGHLTPRPDTVMPTDPSAIFSFISY